MPEPVKHVIGDRTFEIGKLRLGTYRQHVEALQLCSAAKPKGEMPSEERVEATITVVAAAIAERSPDFDFGGFRAYVDTLDFDDAYSQLTEALAIAMTGSGFERKKDGDKGEVTADPATVGDRSSPETASAGYTE